MKPNEKKLEALDAGDFAAFLTGDVAYIRRIEQDGMTGFAVHSADGELLTILADRKVAFAAVRQNGLEPLSVH